MDREGVAGKMLAVGWWGSLMNVSKNILKQGVGKSKSCSQGDGVLKVSPPMPENFNHTHGDNSGISEFFGKKIPNAILPFPCSFHHNSLGAKFERSHITSALRKSKLDVPVVGSF